MNIRKFTCDCCVFYLEAFIPLNTCLHFLKKMKNSKTKIANEKYFKRAVIVQRTVDQEVMGSNPTDGRN